MRHNRGLGRAEGGEQPGSFSTSGVVRKARRFKRRTGVLCYSGRYGHFSGINRKVQLTYLPRGHLKASSDEEGRY